MTRTASNATTETWYAEDFICMQCGEPVDHGVELGEEVEVRTEDSS